ncbi:hypothetical protein TIFTF001_009823 [Ficus carica]|uniref:Uncharacterized protein n=1 Tax=Ficus carica TaxID=3494 RepID=A0AA87ZUE1_FICCA|nr:hypothetical protein TIFTF001_009823 [Ficus carica]
MLNLHQTDTIAWPWRPHRHDPPIATASQSHSLATVVVDGVAPEISNSVATTASMSQVRSRNLRRRGFPSSPGLRPTCLYSAVYG